MNRIVTHHVYPLSLLLLLLISSLTTSTIHADNRTWNCTLQATETNGRIDTTTIGEATNATDGPTPDAYDIVKPPTPPEIPYLRFWLDDHLPTPYDALWDDIRKGPATDKTWNLTLQWMPQDYTTPTTVTLTWTPAILNTSEYTTILLCNQTGATLQDMRLHPSYSFTCPAVTPQQLTIHCHANQPPTTPQNPVPTNASTQQSTTPTLQWTSHDPDDTLITYDIYFGRTATPSQIVNRQANAQFTPSPLDEGTRYYWRIVAWDASNASTTGPLWSFTTMPSSDGHPPDNGSQNTTTPPTASFNVNPHSGLVGEPVLFNASASHSDRYLTSWLWDFGDSTTGFGETTLHSYYRAGNFTVRLQVIDSANLTGTSSQIIHVDVANNPPTTPHITGPFTGTNQTLYSFNIVSSDPDNDSLQYTVYWGDQTNNQSPLLESGLVWTVHHAWMLSGKYQVSAVASDAAMASPSAVWTVYIDVNFIGERGFLFDANGDGRVDSFHDNSSVSDVAVQRLSSGSYQFTVGSTQFLYDPITGSLVNQGEQTNASTGFPWVFAGVLAVVIAVIGFIAYAYWKGFF